MMRKTTSLIILFYLRFFARVALAIHKPKTIGITGSVGKSSARNAVHAVLKDHFSVKTIEKGNSETGIPLGILGLAPVDYSLLDWARMLLLCPFGMFYLKGAEYLIIEMGVDEPYPPKNMGFLLTIVKPDIAVFLNAAAVHTMQFEQTLSDEEKKLPDEKRKEILVQKIAEEKGRIITESGCEVGIYNQAQFKSQKAKVKNTIQKSKLFSFGEDLQDNVQYQSYDVSLRGTRFGFKTKDNTVFFLDFPTYVLPEVYREVFAASVLAGMAVGLSIIQITEGLQKNFSLPRGRASLFEGIRDSVIIDSSYNASYSSVSAFLRLCFLLKKQTGRSLVFVFGDMRELGEESKLEHEKIAEMIGEGVDYLYCVGEMTKKYIIEKSKVKSQKSKIQIPTSSRLRGASKSQKLFPSGAYWFRNSGEVGNYLKNNLPEQSLVLVKGSQNTIFLEESVKAILKHKSDEKNLCRQEEFWMRKKQYSV